ncbi:MAG: alpha-glucosidase/alpha-galactosidase, partial [Clostridia bacterium]|nr:alpha-glucosidase/alpha-galactosidase [Clostridia bacterium]
DRHLVEFLNSNQYLSDPETVKKWAYNLTSVDWRERDQAARIAETVEMSEGKKPFPVVKSDEIAVDLMKAVMGFSTIVSNVNMPNRGQAPQLPLGAVVETNCVFSNGQVKPIVSKPLPLNAANLVMRNCLNIEALYDGIKRRDLNAIYQVFVNQPLCSTLTFAESRALFKEMCENTRGYLAPYYDLDGYFKN